MTSKFINLLAISSLAILACSFGPTPVNALTGEVHNLPRHSARSHDHFVKKRKRGDKQRCKVRPPADGTSAAAAPASGDASTAAASAGSPNSGGGSGGGSDNSGGGSGGGNNNSGNNSGQPATQPQQSSGSPPPFSSGTSKKVGWAWPNGRADLDKFVVAPNTPLYNWSPFLTDGAKDLGFNVIPMMWGEKDIGNFLANVKPGYANHVMGFNEPNEVGQSNIPDGRYGCQLWQQYIAPLKNQGYRLISPGTSSRPNGFDWMKDFFAAGCDADVVALHWYDINVEDFKAYVTKFHDAFGKPIWVTEYACQNFNGGPQKSRDEIFDFHQQVTAWMNETPFVENFFPFGAMREMQGVDSNNQLMANDGGPTDLGNRYIHG